jgi:glucans biosynthesis protein
MRGTDQVVQDVSSVLFLRKSVARIGIAPLTSMFWYGEGDRDRAKDWRPEIHDSDGLAIRTGKDERIWRPLINPRHPETNAFGDDGPRGFGLLQRDRDFDHYQDDGVFYEKRPSLWIEPKGNWGKGAVVLYAFPTDSEYADNVCAMWSPAGPTSAGQRLAYDYRMRWIGGEPEVLPVARAIACRRGQGNVPGKPPSADVTKLVVDFAGPRFSGLNFRAPVRAEVSVSKGRVVNSGTYPVDGQNNVWRLILDIQHDPAQPTDIRAFLKLENQALTETWIYHLA